jgi:mycothiol synthase
VILPPGYEQRPAGEPDIDAIVDLFCAFDIADFGEPDTSRDMVAESFASPFTQAQVDTRLISAPDGAVVAFGVLESVTPSTSQDYFARVHPDHRGRGLGSALLDWGESRARERLHPGERTRFLANTSATDEAGSALMGANGLRHVRSFWHMERTLRSEDRSVAAPPGVTLRPFDPTSEWPVFHALVEASFADHWNFESVTVEQHQQLWASLPAWRPDLVVFAEVDGRPAGVVASFVTDLEGVAWIGELGVLREHRGRGIAQTLLHRAFADFSSLGLTHARLNVDAQNATGATRLYEKVGMTVRREWLVFEKMLGPDQTAPAGGFG